ncbi:MAG: RNase A-like domain-containing protein [bacterium]
MFEVFAITAALHAEPSISGVPDRPHAAPISLCQRGSGQRRSRPRYRGRPRLGPGSLRAHENHVGHSFRKHIGRSPEQLRTRLRRDPDLRVVSTFYTTRGAQRAIRDALRRNERKINEWLNRGGYGRISVKVRYPHPIGMYLLRGMKKPRPGRTATFRLLADDWWPGGFQVVTAMVEP